MNPDYVTVDVRLVGSERDIKLAAEQAGVRLIRIDPSQETDEVVIGYGTMKVYFKKDLIAHYATTPDRELSA